MHLYSPLFTWRSGQPVRVNVGLNAQAFGEIYGNGNSANYEEAAGAAPYTGDSAAHYNVTSSSTVGSGGNPAKGGSGINMFADPAAIFAEFRRTIPGVDQALVAPGYCADSVSGIWMQPYRRTSKRPNGWAPH